MQETSKLFHGLNIPKKIVSNMKSYPRKLPDTLLFFDNFRCKLFLGFLVLGCFQCLLTFYQNCEIRLRINFRLQKFPSMDICNLKVLLMIKYIVCGTNGHLLDRISDYCIYFIKDGEYY